VNTAGADAVSLRPGTALTLLGTIRALNRLACMGEAMRHTLNRLEVALRRGYRRTAVRNGWGVTGGARRTTACPRASCNARLTREQAGWMATSCWMPSTRMISSPYDLDVRYAKKYTTS
jgi:hypothetical protein